MALERGVSVSRHFGSDSECLGGFPGVREDGGPMLETGARLVEGSFDGVDGVLYDVTTFTTFTTFTRSLDP